MKPSKPPYPTGAIKEYRKLLLKAIKSWQRKALVLIKALFTQIQDSLTGDLINRLRSLWDRQVEALRAEITAIFKRLNERQRAWWLGVLESATGVTASVFLSLIREPWLNEEQQSRIESNVLIVGAIGATALASINSLIRNQIRSGVLDLSQRDLRPIFERMVRAAEYHSRNQIEEHNGALNQNRQQEAGVLAYTWLRTVSKHPRKEHLDRVGQHFMWDAPPAGGHPGTEPNCKCGSAPYFPDFIYGFPVRR